MVGIIVHKKFAIVWFLCWSFVFLTELSRAERLLKVLDEEDTFLKKELITSDGILVNLISFFWPKGIPSFHHVWPELEFDWKLVVGTIIGFFGAALGSIGGVGGGGIFVPMLTLIIGFDPKSSTAISKCMIMGAAFSTVYYNLRLRHPTLELPIIDYDLALLFQPMLMLGVSIGVVCNIIFADWMVTILLIILFLGTSTKALIKGIETWKQETIMKKAKSFPYYIKISS
ncbi:Sulfite exporter TauE/SafE family protein [Thalictrum thalictroides]|uniref:Sulfite exporter TauE/SafE family protein n=1 Tax=Thalictrum thalictroides TaxID=46969 RepID=A0A7J6W5G9_THATH|nr:Sulfite exporter TauE/SafE family protein [Thalictrum thalictroides]